MNDFIFDLQRFATTEIKKDNSTTIDGVTYTAVEDAVLNLDSDNKVSGVASGSVQAVVAGAENSPTVTFDTSDGAIDFTATGDGSVLTVKQLFPIEFIGGSFTYKGNIIDISKGSDLAIVNQNENYSLRNENHFEYDSRYIFTDSSMTSDSKQVTGKFILTDGTVTRELNLKQLGKVINNFAERGFTLAQGSSEVLTIGSYTLTATAADDDAGLNISLGKDGITLVPNQGDGTLNVALTRGDTEIISGVLECSSGSITLGYDHAVTFAKDTTFDFTWNNNYVFTVSTNDKATTNVELTSDGKILFTPGSNDGGLNISLTKSDETVFDGELNITNGSISFDPAEQKFSFTQGTKIALTMGGGSQEIDFEIADKDASFKVEADGSGNFTITPDENDGSIDVTLKQNDETIFQNNLSVNGPMIFNPATQLLTLKDGTTVSVTFNDYTLTATADGDAASTISLTSDGISITPDTTDKGKLKLTLTGTSSGSLSADIEILSGGFLFGTDGALTVTKGTELQIDFGNDYIVNFKATDKAGGVISIGTDGITFAPNSDEEDGGLQLTVKRGDDTRTASLDVTGSVTYKLDGTISLTKGTVVKNVFDDGNILTITANTDASGSILFNPQTGLTINPKTADALTATLTTGDLEVAKFTSIDGSITYSNGIVTAGKGTSANLRVYDTWDTKLSTSGGTSSIQFTDDRTIYTANDGATFVLDYLDDTTLEIQNGSFTDIYATETSDAIELVSVGSTFKANDEEFVFTLEKAGDYTLNGIDVTTSEDNTKVVLGGDYDTVQFAADAGITVSATEDKGFRFKIGDDGTITITPTDSGDFGVSSGSITFGDGQAAIAKGTTISMTTNDRVATFTADKDISVSSKIEDDIYYLTLDEATADVTIAQDDKTILAGEMVIDGVFSYRPETGTYGLTGANSSHGDGNNTSLQFTTEGPTGTYTFKAETNDTTVVFVPTFSDGKFEVNFPNENKQAMKFTVSKDGEEVFANNVAVNGTVGFDTAKHELSLTKDTVLTLTQGNNSIEITALADAGGKLNIVDGGLRFAPNENDGALELNFVSANRKANIDVTGAIDFGEGGKISLEKDTVVNFTWEDDGTKLKLTSKGSTGSIGMDDKGIKITSEDENLTIDLTTATGYSTTVSSIQGTIYYNAGSVIIEEGTSLTGTGSINGQAVDVTLEAQGGDGSLTFGATGMTYAAGTGALKVILTSSSGEESTFTVNSGSVFIGSNTFKIAEGTDLATDLKDFVPALNFTTQKAGTYTINGQKITTSTANLALTATDDYMTFKTSDDVVKYDGMTFAGAGNVSLTNDGVVLGAGVEASGFEKDKTFILAEAGNVTADAKIFELTEDVPTGISVKGAQDGFIFSRTTTAESEARLGVEPPEIGKVFTEEFYLTNDDSYRIQTDLLGLQKIIGVSAPSTVNADAIFDGEKTYSIFDIVTDEEGTFNIAGKTYSISGDSEVEIKSRFENGQASVLAFNELSGTVSGDFTASQVSVNGSALGVQPIDDTLISIAADENGFEVSGLDDSSLLSVSATDTYIVNGTTINANAGDYIAGGGENVAYLLAMNNDTVVTGTEFNDYLANHGTNVTINALGGSDTVMNYGTAGVTVNAGTGNDFIFNVARVDSETGKVISSPDNVSITGGTGNDYIAAEGSLVTITGGAGKDTIVSDGDSASIDAGKGNDSIEVNGDNASVNAGAGSNQIKISGKNEVILLKGRTSVEGFNTGFGDGSDTIYIKPENDPAGVEFLEGGLTFGNSTASLTLSDVKNTAKVNLFHENRDMLNKGVFIAAGEWYSVESSDLSVNSGEEVYFVGTAADPKAGVDFSGITADLNVTMDTAYIDSEEYVEGTPFWVNGVYSIKGGAGNTTIIGSKKDDTILAGTGSTTIDAREGSNQIKLSDDSNDVIVFNGQTTVEGFKTGFGEGADTIYIPEEYPGVDYKNGVLTFYDDTNSLTFKDITSTAQITTYYAANGTTDKQVYIADNEWYKVTDGEAQYYIGATASKNHGIDFSGITRSINATLDTADEANDESTWINNVYSIRGGDGLTTITGSEKSDTIISGTGETTINAAGGDDLISLSGSAALINYAEGDGNDSIYGFDSKATLSIGDNIYSTQVSGNDLIITIGESKLTLVDGAKLDNPNIASTNSVVRLVENLLKRTAAGYPVIAGALFPEATFDEPTNYAAKDNWSIKSADDLELHGVCYTPENSSDKWVVLVHGYGQRLQAMYPFAAFYLANNYNVLMIDQRAAGESEGTWLTMGAAESQDVALWTQEIAERYPNAKITLHGVSMGSATVMLAAARSDTVNVTSLIEDCGYSSVMELFALLNEAYGIGATPQEVKDLDPVGYGMTGYYLHNAAPIDSISSAKMPTMFISGDDDGVVPVTMLGELYDKSGADVKEKFIVEGAGHAQAGLNDSVGYSNAVFRFIAEANGEGWETENIFDNISLRGTKYNDTISNGGENVTIDTGDGDDYISNIADNVSIDAGAGNDTIYNHADNITIDAGDGNDSISNNSDNVVFIWSGGDDTIDGFKEDSVLSIGSAYSTQQSGDDVIVTVGDNTVVLTGTSSLDNLDIIGEDGSTFINYNDNSLVSGTTGNDSIINYGTNSTIQAKGGMDTIYNEAANSIIDAGDGSDSISNSQADNVSISAGKGLDTIINEHAYNVTLDGGNGNDKIIVRRGDHTTIYGGAGNDTILGETVDSESSTWAMGGYANIDGGNGDDYINPVFSDSASIFGGEGNDTIINEGDDSTLNGGAGNDIISLHGASLENNVIKYEVGEGNDTIFGFNETSKLSITAGTEYSTVVSGEDVIVNVGSNKITIADGAGLSTVNITNEETKALNTANTVDNTLITGTELADTINNAGEEVTIKAMAGNDSIVSSGSEGSLNGGAGDDILENSGNNSTLLGEYGNDKLTNNGDEVLISGGYGNDTISNSGDFVSINGGSGNNLIENTGDNVFISMNGGLDTIYGFSENSTLSLSSDDYETLYGGKDIIVSVGNDFALLKNAFYMNDSLNINGKTIEVTDKVLYLLPGDDAAQIGRSNVSIVSGDGDDQISLTSDAKNNVIQYESGSGNDTIYGYNDSTRISISGDYTFVKDGDDVIFKVGNESITVVDGGNVMDLDFEDGESIVLTEAGAVTVEGKVFELTKKVPDGVTITGTQDGFTSSVTEDGKIFAEEFIAQGDDSYNVSIDGKGLQTISGIDAGTEVTTNATKDGEESENLIYIVTEDAGSYTFNEMQITTTKANAVIRLRPQAMAFDASDGIIYDGKTFSGEGRVAVSVDSVILGSSVSASGFDKGESFILAQKGSTTVDGRVFELTENISDGMTIEGADNGYTFSHTITQKEVTQNNLPSSYAGKIVSENVVVEGDETYSLRADTFGLRRVRGISDGATILGGDTSVDGNSNDKYAKDGQYFYVDTDTEGVFTIGEKTYSISGDSNVEIVAEFLPEKSYASGFNNLEGTVRGDFDGETFYVNGNKPILVEGDEDFYVVGSSSGTKLFGVSGNATLASLGGVKEVHTDTEGEFWIGAEPVPFGVTVTGDDNVTFGFDYKGELTSVDNLEGDIEFSKGTGGALSINGIGIQTKGTEFSSIGAYDNSLYIHDIKGGTITAYEPDKVWLQMLGETMTLNGNRLTLTEDEDGIWLRDKEIVGLDDGASLQVSKNGTYTANETSLKAKAGDVIVGLENDAYIYDANNPLITRKTSNAEIIDHFKPNQTEIITSSKNLTLEGGDLAIVENTSAQVNITAGDDTIVSQGENVRVTLTPEKNTWLFPIDGKMTLEGYDASTGSGFGTTYKNILSEIEKGNVDFNNGILKLGSAQVDMSKSSELMNFFNRYSRQEKVGFASTNDSLDVSNETDDLLLVAKKNSTVKSGSGDDTILANENSFVDGGAGKNLVKSNGGNSNIVLNGRTTVEGFHTGWGEGSDTVYINVNGDPAVDFKTSGLTFYDDKAKLTLSDLSETAKVNLYYEGLDRTRRSVFIAKNDWYKVSNSDLATGNGEGIYFVGTSTTRNHGIDFSDVTTDLNIIMNTDYRSTTAEFWVNNIHSLKGGAGNTTIIGSDKSDTILAGSGEQKIYGGEGHDKMFGNTSADKNVATFFYMAGDGRDSISNFDFTNDALDVTADKVQLDDGSAITDVFLRGDDVGIRIDGSKEFLMLEGAQGKSFRVNDDLIAKVDKNVAFDGFTNCYIGIGTKATLTVGKGLGDVEVWLSDDSLEYHGTMYDGGFAVLDASQADGSNILAGNELNNSIIGGTGSNSLWGGYSSESDTLVGGAGQNTFFYGTGNGRDKIQNAHAGDEIILDDITLDQIAEANITAGGVILNFTDGGSLTIDGTADVTYQLADGSRYSADHATHDWVQK